MARLLLVLLVGVGCTRQETPPEAKPGRSIVLTGVVLAAQDVEVTSPTTTVVREVLVDPGQTVMARQVIARLDTSAARTEVMRAEAAVAAARARVAQAQAGTSRTEIAQARAEVDQTRIEVERQRRLTALPARDADDERSSIMLETAKAKLERLYPLYGRGLVSRPELEIAHNEYAEALHRREAARDAHERRSASGTADLEIAQARHAAARARLAGLETASRRWEVDVAQAQVRQAEADLARARATGAQSFVESPIRGIATDVKIRPGQRVYEREVLARIIDISNVHVRADLSPGLAPLIRVGQPVQVTVNTVPPTTVATSVQRILAVADPKTQSLSLFVILPNPRLTFQPGFTARLEIAASPPPAPRTDQAPRTGS